MGEKFSSENAKGCFQVILIMIGLLFISIMFYAILNGIEKVINLIPWYLWILIIILFIWVYNKRNDSI